MEAASNYASSHGGGAAVYDAYICGFVIGNKERLRNNGQLKPIDDEYTFDRWWKMYSYSVDKEKCRVKWHNVLTFEERKRATEHTPIYVAATPDKKFRRHPYSYLTRKTWENKVDGMPQLVEADAEKFMEYFNKKFEYTDIPKLSEMTDERKGLLNTVYTLYRNDILSVLDKVKESRHLTGEDGSGFRATFEWIFKPSNFLRIKEGYYDR